jgi:predicted ABC-type ATPase
MILDRVVDRVRKGGHHVSDADVRRRYQRGINNFWNVYRPLVDSWIVIENSLSWPREVVFARGGEPTIVDIGLFQQFSEAVELP